MYCTYGTIPSHNAKYNSLMYQNIICLPVHDHQNSYISLKGFSANTRIASANSADASLNMVKHCSERWYQRTIGEAVRVLPFWSASTFEPASIICSSTYNLSSSSAVIIPSSGAPSEACQAIWSTVRTMEQNSNTALNILSGKDYFYPWWFCRVFL